MASVAAVLLARRYGLACDCYGPCSDSKVVDAQFGYERSVNALLGLAARPRLLSGVGEIQAGVGSCLEVLMIDDEVLNNAFYALAERPWDADALDVDAIVDGVLSGHGFLGTKHTRRYIRSEFVAPLLSYRGGAERVAGLGAPRRRRHRRRARGGGGGARAARPARRRAGRAVPAHRGLCRRGRRRGRARSARGPRPVEESRADLGAARRHDDGGASVPVSFPYIQAKGSYRELGRAVGEGAREQIAAALAFYEEHFRRDERPRASLKPNGRRRSTSRTCAGTCRSTSRSWRAWPRARASRVDKLLVPNCAEEFTCPVDETAAEARRTSTPAAATSARRSPS